MKKQILLGGVSLALGVLLNSASATVIPYSWIRAGEAGVFTDSSGLAHNFNAAFSSLGGGNPATVIEPFGVGGPLGGPNGPISTSCTRWGYYDVGNSGMWIQGQGGNGSVPGCDLWCLPPTNWVMECWVLPVGTGAPQLRTDSQFVSTGSGQFGGTAGGAAMNTHYNGDGTITITAHSIGANNSTIGDPVITDTNHWIHVAVVNDNGVTTFYVNGVVHGDPNGNVTAPSGVPYIGSGQDTGAPFNGYLDEVRYSTFAPGQFSPSDLLTRANGPSIVTQPASENVWNGGAAVFDVQTVYDGGNTFQWSENGVEVFQATSPELFVPLVSSGDNASIFNVVVSNSGTDVTSSNATLTVVPNETANVAYYRAAVQAEPSLVAYFPVDGDTGGTIENSVDLAFPGTLENNASYDGRTDRSYGERALRFNGDGDVVIANNPVYEFAGGSGTIEAIVYMSPATIPLGYETLFAMASSSTTAYYQLQANPSGTSLAYSDDSLSGPIIWPLPNAIMGRRAHVAFVFSPGSVTAYVDGESLGTQAHANFGGTTGLPGYIGSSGAGTLANPGAWYGTIDELAIYSSALSANTIAIHNSRFVFGTAVTGPSIDSVPTGSKTLLAGGAPVFKAKASGTAPLSYQWTLNGAPITGNASAMTPTLQINPSTTLLSGNYAVIVSNDVSSVTSLAFTVTFIAPPDTYSSYVMADTPTAFWRMNETSGTALIDSASGLDGAYQGGFSLGVPGFHTGITAAHFDGSSGRAIVPLTSILNPNNPFSIELWGQLDNNGGNRVALSSLDRPSRGAGYEFYMGGNYNGWEFHTGGGGNYDALQGDSTKQPVGPWYHVVGIYTGSNILLYVNGKPGDVHDGSEVTSPPFTPNTAKPLYIGSRSDSAVWWPGAIANVAFYNYQLTPDQITKHFSIVYVASAIVTQPADAHVIQPANVTLNVAASGFPNTYQWFKGAVPLDAGVTNSDGSAHYPGGVTSTNLVIAQSAPNDSGSYHVEVTNPLGGSVSQSATVTVDPDVTPPVVLAAASVDGTTIDVAFDEALDPGDDVTQSTAEDFFNYRVDSPDGVAVLAAALQPGHKTVRLTVDGLVGATTFMLNVANVKDYTRLDANAIPAAGEEVTGYVQDYQAMPRVVVRTSPLAHTFLIQWFATARVQWAPTPAGPWNDVPGSPTSPYVATDSGTKFYRVVK